MREPTERLRDILDAIGALERQMVPDKASFEADELRQTWFVHHLQIIGEAARALPVGIRMRAPTVPWSHIIGMRNILVHGYFGIDTDIVWRAATGDVPQLKLSIQALLDEIATET